MWELDAAAASSGKFVFSLFLSFFFSEWFAQARRLHFCLHRCASLFFLCGCFIFVSMSVCFVFVSVYALCPRFSCSVFALCFWGAFLLLLFLMLFIHFHFPFFARFASFRGVLHPPIFPTRQPQAHTLTLLIFLSLDARHAQRPFSHERSSLSLSPQSDENT